ncbi:hypothetical protein F442_02851 [Phytophthora nicotianae P10297]|uniref:RxLR effector protein n=1 Tax=Phytophthora nicotianae P10297 TaxID=1317064 RepID=W2ZXS5_PHYNI|nr:hypothetical protein F442_02851 [Phytophthora nicotianae P10297]
MRITDILRATLALTLLASGSASSTVDESQSTKLLQSLDAVQKGGLNENRNLRSDTPRHDLDYSTEERGKTWTQLKNFLSMSADEESKIKKLATTFAGYKADDLIDEADEIHSNGDDEFDAGEADEDGDFALSEHSDNQDEQENEVEISDPANTEEPSDSGEEEATVEVSDEEPKENAELGDDELEGVEDDHQTCTGSEDETWTPPPIITGQRRDREDEESALRGEADQKRCRSGLVAVSEDDEETALEEFYGKTLRVKNQ